MAALTLTEQYLNIVDENPELAGVQTVTEYLSSTGGIVDCALAPKVLDAESYAVLGEASAIFTQIMGKIVAGARRSSKVRALFDMGAELEHLTAIPSGYPCEVPLLRLDVFFDEVTHDLKVVGVNAEVADGLSLASRLSRAVAATPATRSLGKSVGTLRAYDLVRQIVRATLDTYETWANAGEGLNHPTSPSLAIVGFDDIVLKSDIETCLARFREVGVYAHFSKIEDLRIETFKSGSRLVDSYGPLSCVLRACSSRELIKRDCPGAQALINAAHRGYSCVVPSFGTLVGSTKTFFPVLRHPECQDLLTKEECAFIEEHVPETHLLGPEADISRFYDREEWVVKTRDGVKRGIDMTKQAWRIGLVKGIKNHDVVQAYAPRREVTALVADGDELRKESAADLYSLYVFRGELCGVGAHFDVSRGRLAAACLVAE